MSIKTEMERISANVAAALDAIRAKGVTVPSDSNSDDLATLIAKIVTVDSAEAKYGHSVTVSYGDEEGYEAEMTVFARDVSPDPYNKYSSLDLFGPDDSENYSNGWESFMAKFAQGMIYPADGAMGANKIAYVKKVYVAHSVDGGTYNTPAFEAYKLNGDLVWTFDVLSDDPNLGNSGDMSDDYEYGNKHYSVTDVVSTVDLPSMPSYERFAITE